MDINFVMYLIVPFITVVISLMGIILNGSNVIIAFLSIEMLLLSINYIFIIYSRFLDDILGQIYSLLFLTIGAAESAIGLGILIAFFKIRKNVYVFSSLLKH